MRRYLRGRKSHASFEHMADMGLIGRGETMAEAFESVAEAMFSVMTDVSAVQPVQSVRLEFDEPDPELALVVWLNRLLLEARTRGLVFSRFHLHQDQDRWVGEAAGQPWSEALVRGTEVKGATLTALQVKQTDGAWEARCVVDV